jgi:hypothetical protein
MLKLGLRNLSTADRHFRDDSDRARRQSLGRTQRSRASCIPAYGYERYDTGDTHPTDRPPDDIARVPKADDGSRTRDLELGKLALYQLSYVRV